MTIIRSSLQGVIRRVPVVLWGRGGGKKKAGGRNSSKGKGGDSDYEDDNGDDYYSQAVSKILCVSMVPTLHSLSLVRFHTHLSISFSHRLLTHPLIRPPP